MLVLLTKGVLVDWSVITFGGEINTSVGLASILYEFNTVLLMSCIVAL